MLRIVDGITEEFDLMRLRKLALSACLAVAVAGAMDAYAASSDEMCDKANENMAGITPGVFVVRLGIDAQ